MQLTISNYLVTVKMLQSVYSKLRITSSDPPSATQIRTLIRTLKIFIDAVNHSSLNSNYYGLLSFISFPKQIRIF